MKQLFLAVAILLTPCATSAQIPFPSQTGGSSSASIPNYTANGGLPNFKACLASIKASPAAGIACNVIVIGHSQSDGHGSFASATGNDAHSGAWPNALKTVLGLSGIPVSTATITGNSNIGSGATFNAYDTRATAGTWTPNTGVFVLGASLWGNADTTAFVFNPTDSTTYTNALPIQTNKVDVYWVGGTGPVANLTLDTGGAAFCTINMNTPSGFTFNKTTCTTTLATNTYNAKCSAGTANFCTWLILDSYNSAVSSVHIFNGAADGANITQFATLSGPWDTITSMQVIQPKLCIMGDVINSASAQISLANYTTAYNALISACKANGGDVLLFTDLPPQGTTSPITIPQYQSTLIGIATSNNVAIWDSMAAYGGPTGWQAFVGQGWTFDGAHYSAAGYAYEGSNFARILQQ